MSVIPAGSATVVASVHKLSRLDDALHSPAPCVLLTNVHVGNIASLVEHCHSMGKPVFVRPDLVEGLRSDAIGIRLLKQAFHVDGVFTSLVQTGHHALDVGLDVFWRVFLLDSRALETSLAAMGNSPWTGFEFVPGPMALRFASAPMEASQGRPLVAGGFVSDVGAARELFAAGYSAVNTSSGSVWNLRTDVAGSSATSGDGHPTHICPPTREGEVR